jgi:Tat protein translocase TatB subunit
MGSLGTGEILVIVLVALIVFGPHRLPEITRKAGEWLGKAREMTRAVTDTIDAEYGEVTKPIKDLKGEYDATMGEMKGIASSVTDMSFDLSGSGRQPGDESNDDEDEASTPDGDEGSTSSEETP